MLSGDADPDESVGIIVPPPEVKEILETTAIYVGKKPALEARVLEKHDKDPRFSFLKVSDPYHAYYCSKVADVRDAVNGEGKAPEEAPRKPNERSEISDPKQAAAFNVNGEPQPKESDSRSGARNVDKDYTTDRTEKQAYDERNTTKGTAKVSFLKSIRAKEEAARPEPREPPSDDLFTLINVNPPPHALGLEVMKLSAQFVAKHGQDFLLALGSKESRNSLFDFLKPLHPHFIVFQRLVDAYKAILAGHEAASLVSKDRYQCEKAIMDGVWYMHDWECQRAEREHEAALDESEKLKVAQIDWHDFVVLETVDIDENEKDLPAPVADAKQLPKILAAAKKAEQEREKNRGNVDMDIDPSGEAPRVELMSKTVERDGMVVTVDLESEIPIDRIRKAPAVTTAKAVEYSEMGVGAEEQTVVLPSGQRVPLSKAEASMRAELLNPSYKDERARAAAKNRMQNLAGGEEVARNLARWEQQRTEAGVYNRGDLQGALATLPKPSPAEADSKLRKAEPSGPNRPGMEKEVLSPPAKRARVEAAKEALEKAVKKKEAEAVAADEEAAAAEATGIAVADKLPGLLTAEEWLKKQGQYAQVRLKMPAHSNKEWNLQGQEMEMKAPLKKMVSNLKSVIAKWTNLPANKQKLQIEGVGFLKDKMTLAFYNVGDGTKIMLEVKERGGRKRHH